MEKTEHIVLGGGCFWCTEAVFKMLRGVINVVPGYAGGTISHPTYEQVCSGDTGYVEVIRIDYDPSILNLKDVFAVFFASHDPTTLNRQGNDVGTQYRSVIFYTTDVQKSEAEAYIADINASTQDGDPIVTTVEPLSVFYEAEDYHKDYFARNRQNPYCSLVINPKLEKVQKKFAALLEDKNLS